MGVWVHINTYVGTIMGHPDPHFPVIPFVRNTVCIGIQILCAFIKSSSSGQIDILLPAIVVLPHGLIGLFIKKENKIGYHIKIIVIPVILWMEVTICKRTMCSVWNLRKAGATISGRIRQHF